MAPSTSVLSVLLILSVISPSQSATCTSQSLTFANKLYSFCNDLPSLNSSLHWSYDPALSTLSIVFIAVPPRPGGWISWAINPTGTGMEGSQALIAFRDAQDAMTVKTYNITSYAPPTESRVWYQVRESSAEFSGSAIRLFATIVLPERGKTTLNHVWQVGPSVTNGVLGRHDFQPANLNSRGSLDLMRGQSIDSPARIDRRTRKKNVHGILNGVSWGMMLPVGAIIARYLRAFPSANPAWFYLHICCQVSAYAIGVVGWATGLQLGSESRAVTYHTHRSIGITLFSIATLQILALFLRPKKGHKYRYYWNIYHHGLGYAILILSIINVLKGLSILQPQNKCRNAYIVVIAVLGGVALLLEAITWIVVLNRNKEQSHKPNGNGTKQQPLAP